MIQTLPKILISALLYFLLEEAGAFLTVYQGYATPIYPAAALGLIAVLHGGERFLPAIWLGSFAMKMEIALHSTGITTNAVLLAASISVGACIQAWVAVLLIRHFLKSAWQSLVHDSDILRFFLLAGPLSCLISATWAMLSLLILERIKWTDIPFIWWNWWVGDVLGIILFAPVFLALLYRQWQPWRQRLRTVVIPTLLFTIAIVTAFLYMVEKDQKLLKYQIDGHGVALVNLINRRLLTYQETVESLARLLEIAPDLSRAHFDKFTQPIFNKYSDVNALSWNPLIKYPQRSLFEKRFADENALADFKIQERDDKQQLVIAKPRDSYVFVGYIGPIESNSKALGYDMASNKERLQAINAALQSKQLTATPLRLVQEANNTTGLLLLQPVYGKTTQQGNDVLGFAVGVFKIETMLKQQVLDQLPEGLLFSLEDTHAADESR
ncbi:MAG: CHASE domain-containing protein, partial [Methylovulum sp.]